MFQHIVMLLLTVEHASRRRDKYGTAYNYSNGVGVHNNLITCCKIDIFMRWNIGEGSDPFDEKATQLQLKPSSRFCDRRERLSIHFDSL